MNLDNYEEMFKYNIYEAIKIKGVKKNDLTLTELMKLSRLDPANTPNNPLLCDYDYVYKHAEEILLNNKIDYQQKQGVEQYYTLFRVLIDKYSLEEDYNKYLLDKSWPIKIKWSMFASELISFMTYSFDDRLIELLKRKEVMDYFKRYRFIYEHEKIEGFSHEGLEVFLNDFDFYSYYIDKPDRILKLINRHPKITIPDCILLDNEFIRKVSRTMKIENFYSDIETLGRDVGVNFYLDEHKKFCDYQVNNMKDGIIPYLFSEYDNEKEIVGVCDVCDNVSPYINQVAFRILEKYGEELPKKFFYQELTKYFVMGMLMSRNFEASPYNLLVDIETMVEFAKDNNHELEGKEIYDFLINFEDKSLDEIVRMYEDIKEVPIKDMLYDDWWKVKKTFIDEVNQRCFKASKGFKESLIDGFKCYDITDMDDVILVHNTGVMIDNSNGIDEMIEQVKTGHKHMISLSLQDKKHTNFYNKYCKDTIKFAYGELDANRVGIIYHDDAYSFLEPERVEFGNISYKRTFYTVDSLLEKTRNFNEIVYVIMNKPYMPIGVICEGSISDVEKDVAERLGVPILYREKREKEVNDFRIERREKTKTYSRVPSINFFVD